ncbi:MAG: hypothetical protein WA964_08295 [Ilumatobacter sp.]|uniref:hypothetical protein n=1 Tax=Ilumatobacter sp. TaxID=1967498 RepID=UPI003C776BEA
MRTQSKSKTIRSVLVGAALTATAAVAIGGPSPIASAVGPDGTTCFDSGAPAGAGVIVNGTAAAPGGIGYLNFYQPGPNAEPQETSSVNFAPGAAVANSVITPVADGEICVYNSETVEIIADVAGWIAPDKLLSFTDGAAIRTFDTRLSYTDRRAGKYEPDERFCFNPAGNARADQPTFINVTIAGAESNGFANIYPLGASSPDANSVVNFNAGRNVANGITATTGDESNFCIYTSARAHVIIDVVGAVQSEEFTPANADNTADRILNTRDSSAFAAGEERCVATDADAGESVVLNATSFGANGNGYLNVYSSSASADPADNSVVNFRAGANVANGTIVPAGADGEICVYASAPTQVILDVAGYMAAGVFVPLNADGSATRVLNTRG